MQIDSGLSVKEFCENYAIHRSSFYYWAKKLKESTRQSKFIPVHVKPGSMPMPEEKNILLNKTCPPQGSEFIEPSVEIVYPNGVMIRLNGNIKPLYLKEFISLQD